MPVTNLLNIAPSFQSFFSTGAATYYPTYAFLCSTFTTAPTAGATYTNNSVTFTVTQVVGNICYATASSAPTSTGVLTKASGTGDTTLNFAAYYNPKKIRVRMVAGGGGGSGSGTSTTGGTGGTGGTTTFGTSLLTANGGTGGVGNATAVSGGSASLGSVPIGIASSGSTGASGSVPGTAGNYLPPGVGGNSPFGGAGGVNAGSTSGSSGAANSGAGGGGGGGGGVANSYVGSGGSSGGFIDATITNILSSFPVSVGIGGLAGTAGTSGFAGGAGGTGAIYIEESFSY